MVLFKGQIRNAMLHFHTQALKKLIENNSHAVERKTEVLFCSCFVYFYTTKKKTVLGLEEKAQLSKVDTVLHKYNKVAATVSAFNT